jgi:hypothetical protein
MPRLRFTNITFKDGYVEADCDQVPQGLAAAASTGRDLPAGYDSNPDVGFEMLVNAMNSHNLTAVGVQNHGQQIVDALKATYPSLDVYLSPTDAPVWPGFGSLDVTIDSGRGGWSFRPDHATPYVPKERRR